MSDVYVFDKIGNRQPGMTKEEIKAAIEAALGITEPRENVFTGMLVYNGESISYEYSGIKPTDADICNLLDVALDFDLNLTANDVIALNSLGEFKLHCYVCETHVYITNGHCDVVHVYNPNLGYCEYYANGAKPKKVYYMTSSANIGNIVVLSAADFVLTEKDENTIYLVDDTEVNIVGRAQCDEHGRNIMSTYLQKVYGPNSFNINLIGASMKSHSTSVNVNVTGIELNYNEGETIVKVDKNGISLDGENTDDIYVRQDKRKEEAIQWINGEITSKYLVYDIDKDYRDTAPVITLLDGKTADDIVGLAGTLKVDFGDGAEWNLHFNGLINHEDTLGTGDTTELVRSVVCTEMCLRNYTSSTMGTPYIVQFMLGVSASNKLIINNQILSADNAIFGWSLNGSGSYKDIHKIYFYKLGIYYK